MMRWTIVIFAFNEEGGIGKVIQKVVDFQATADESSVEILIIDDGSTDRTPNIIQEYVKKNPLIRVVSHPRNLGIGKALQSGYREATNDYIVALPADNQFEVELLAQIPAFPASQFYSFYRSNPYSVWFRKLLHMFNRWFNYLLFGIRLRDVNWVKVYRKDQLQRINFEMNSSLIESEICIKLMRMGIQPIEQVSPYLPRESGKSKGGSFQTVSKAMVEMLGLYRVIKQFSANSQAGK
ncbi:MAG: glycosyltransferase family 2 protein [Bacteroidia bacterium]|nr:glycosyltransferase family 2 protein [Bacteroidia bacterium]